MGYEKTYDTMMREFSAIMINGENAICPFSCAVKPISFFASRTVYTGYVTCTDRGRLIVIKQSILGKERSCYLLDAVRKLTIKKNLFGQHVVDCEYPSGTSTEKFRLQIAPKILGMNVPSHEENVQKFISIMNNYIC